MSEAFCMQHVAVHVMLNDGNHTNSNYYWHRCYCWRCCRESTNHSFFFVLLNTHNACANVRRVDTPFAVLRSALLSINNLRHSVCPFFDATNKRVSPSYVHECTGCSKYGPPKHNDFPCLYSRLEYAHTLHRLSTTSSIQLIAIIEAHTYEMHFWFVLR